MHQFTYVKAKDLKEAQRLLDQHGDKARVLAGGTDLIVRIADKIWQPEVIVDIKGLGLSYIKELVPYGLVIGAATPLNEIMGHALVREHFPVLVEGAHVVGSCQIRNRATLGGNLCNASPLADTAPALLVLEAVMVTAGSAEREIPVQEFFAGPGKTVLGKGEILKEIRIPYAKEKSLGLYYKHARTKAVDLAAVGVAIYALESGEIRIALGAVAPTPVRAKKTEEFLRGKSLNQETIKGALEKVLEDISPITDIRSSKEYRQEIAQVLVKRGLGEVENFLAGNEV